MRYAIDIVPLDFSRGNVVDVRIKGFRRVIGCSLVEQRGGIVMADFGQAKRVVQCGLIVEWDPQGTETTCRFVGISIGLCVESKDIGNRQLDHVATLVCDGQPPFAVYRAPIVPPLRAPVDVAPD